MHNSKLNKLSVALCLLLLPVSVFAAGLGRLNMASGIGEPLDASIELLSVGPEELSTIAASVASEQDYSKQGIERPASHGTIKLQVAKNARGEPILKLKSTQPITEPYLDMLIQLDWNTGSLLREYTVLLDPPGYHPDSASASINSPSTQKSSNAQTVKSSNVVAATDSTASSSPSKTSSGKRKKVPTKPAVKSEIAAADLSGQEHLTEKGDTLAKIAREMKPADVSLDQMLVGLYENNKEAFSGNNMNRLKVGQILKAPSEEALQAISAKEAKQEIKIQTQNWNAYTNKLAGIVAESAPASNEADNQSTSGKIKSAAEDKSAANNNGQKDVVKLSSSAQASSTEAKSAQAKLTALQEEVEAREKGLQEAQSRTSALEKQIEDMQKLLALKNNEMAQMQKQAAANEATAKPTQAPTEVKPTSTPTPAESAPATETQPENSVKSAQEQNKKAVEPAAVPATASEPAKPVIKTVPAAAAPVEEPGLIDNILDGQDLPLLAGAGGLLALLAGGWFYLRNKRKKNLADFEQGIMTSGGLKANTVFGNTSGASIDTGDTSFLTDFSQSANGGMIDTNDVDPIAEAEVYMAYGRDAQAEEILKDAITKEPKRYELHLKLLEMYAASKNMSAFETVSGELYTTLGADDPTWAKVAEIGIKLEPNNPLYQLNSNPVGTAKNVTSNATKLAAADFSNSPLAAETDLNFSLDQPADVDREEPAPGIANNVDEELLSFNLDGNQPDSLDDIADKLDAFEKASQQPSLPADGENDGLNFTQSEDTIADLDSFNHEDANALETAHMANTGKPFELTMPDLNFSNSTMESTPFDTELETAAKSPFADEGNANLDLPKLDALKMEEDDLPSTHESELAESLSADSRFNDKDIEAIELTADESTGDLDLEDAKAVDLSDISLELNDHRGEPDPILNQPDPLPDPLETADDEPLEVETKLELVVAYIDMDDKEGAKELLDEVIKEGGKSQRQRAEKLLAQIS